MTRKERTQAVIGWFEANRPIAETELHYTDTFQLLVAVILSAQCTDRRVNMVTHNRSIFERYPGRVFSCSEEHCEEVFEDNTFDLDLTI